MTPRLKPALVATKANPTTTPVVPQTDFQGEQDLEWLASPSLSNPSLSNPSIDNLIGPELPQLDSESLGTVDSFALPGDSLDKKPETSSVGKAKPEANSVADVTEQVTAPVNMNGESVKDISDSTAILLAMESVETVAEPDSFFVSYWPYLILAVAIVGWVASQLFLRRGPSFKHHQIDEKRVDPGTTAAGQFKVSQRFQESKSDDEQASSGAIVATNDSDQPQEVKASKGDRPADDEFDMGFGDGVSDSDVIDPQEAAEIIAAADTRKTKTKVPRPRFKTKTDKKNNVLPKD